LNKSVSFFVPGRLCLFGEHSDWAGEYRQEDASVMEGLCIVAGTDQGIFAEARKIPSGFSISQIMENGSLSEEVHYENSRAALNAAGEPGNFHGYASGTASLILENHPNCGIRLKIFRRTLPLKKGLSSSAAVCVATARAFNQVHELNMPVLEEMDLACRGEILTGSNCGRMDQACALGGDPVLLSFNGRKMEIRKVKHTGTIHVLIVDLQSRKNTRKILHDLNQAFKQGNKDIRRALGQEISSGEELGRIMTRAQEVFDSMVAPCSPRELSAPVLHKVLEIGENSGLTWGGKGVGSQGDGTAQFICKGLEEKEKLKNILEDGNRYICYSLTL